MNARVTAAKKRVAKAPEKRQPRLGRTLGPVDSLEDHLPEEWWKTVFTKTYLMTDGDVVENADNTREDIDLVSKIVPLSPETRVLDVCCGQGRHTLELASRGLRALTGVDQSRELLTIARKRAREAGFRETDARFLEADARALPLEDCSIDLVMLLGNSFGYFASQADDRAVLAQVRRVLVPGGALLLDLTDGAQVRATFERRSWEWIDRRHLVVRERQLSRDQRRLVCREVVMHASKGVVVDQFYAETLYTRDDLRALLEGNGFRAVEVHGADSWSSTREQDLGMMAARMVITARA